MAAYMKSTGFTGIGNCLDCDKIKVPTKEYLDHGRYLHLCDACLNRR